MTIIMGRKYLHFVRYFCDFFFPRERVGTLGNDLWDMIMSRGKGSQGKFYLLNPVV